MIRTATALAAILTSLPSGMALAEPLAPTGGAGNTGVRPPSVVGGVPAGTVRERDTIDDRPDVGLGNAANRSNSRVPGTTPDVNIGGTPTSGPPGTGGAAGGPSISGQ